MVAGGERFKAGETMQIGWMLTRLELGERGRLRVMEPDMMSLPIVFIDSVKHTIRDLRAQKDSVDSVLPPGSIQFPDLRHSLVVQARTPDYDAGARMSELDSLSSSPFLCTVSSSGGCHGQVA